MVDVQGAELDFLVVAVLVERLVSVACPYLGRVAVELEEYYLVEGVGQEELAQEHVVVFLYHGQSEGEQVEHLEE
jgi:hypothetical protein